MDQGVVVEKGVPTEVFANPNTTAPRRSAESCRSPHVGSLGVDLVVGGREIPFDREPLILRVEDGGLVVVARRMPERPPTSPRA